MVGGVMKCGMRRTVFSSTGGEMLMITSQYLTVFAHAACLRSHHDRPNFSSRHQPCLGRSVHACRSGLVPSVALAALAVDTTTILSVSTCCGWTGRCRRSWFVTGNPATPTGKQVVLQYQSILLGTPSD